MNTDSKNIEEEREMYEGFREFFKNSIEKERQEARQEGLQEGRKEGIEKTIATDMLKKFFPLSMIEEISKLSEDVIRNIAASMGIAIS